MNGDQEVMEVRKFSAVGQLVQNRCTEKVRNLWSKAPLQINFIHLWSHLRHLITQDLQRFFLICLGFLLYLRIFYFAALSFIFLGIPMAFRG